MSLVTLEGVGSDLHIGLRADPVMEHIATDALRIAQAAQQRGFSRDLYLAFLGNLKLQTVHMRGNSVDALVRREMRNLIRRVGRTAVVNGAVLDGPSARDETMRAVGLDSPPWAVRRQTAEVALNRLLRQGVSGQMDDMVGSAERLYALVEGRLVSGSGYDADAHRVMTIGQVVNENAAMHQIWEEMSTQAFLLCAYPIPPLARACVSWTASLGAGFVALRLSDCGCPPPFS